MKIIGAILLLLATATAALAQSAPIPVGSLPSAATPLAGTDYVVVGQPGTSSAILRKTTVSAILAGAVTGGGIVASGQGSQVAYYASTGATVSGSLYATLSGGALTLGTVGTPGTVAFSGSSTGATTIGTPATAGNYTFNLPSTAGTFGQALETDGSGNTFWSASASGTVTSVGLSMPSIFGVTGTPVTGAGAFNVTLNNQNAGLFLGGPVSGSPATPGFRAINILDLPSTSTILDQISSTQGTVLYRGSGGWAALSPGTTGQFLETQGGGANPQWASATGSGTVNSCGSSGEPAYYAATGTAVSCESLSALIDANIGSTQGDVLYRNGTVWTVLPPGTSGQFLETQGAAANPQWASASGSGTVNSGTTNQIAGYSANGTAVGGLTVAGDGTASISGGSIDFVITKTNGVAFAPSATTDATNASNISSGTLASARGGAGSVTGALKGNGSGAVSQAACADLSNGGTACSQATGTSGATLPFLNGTNTWSGTQTFGTVVGGTNSQSGTTYTLAATDCGKTLIFTSSSAITLTTLNSLSVGCALAVEQASTAKVTVSNGSGATFNSAHSYTGTSGQYSIIGLFVDTNVGGSAAHFVLTGDGS